MKKSAAPKLTKVSLHLGRLSGGNVERRWRLTIEDKPSNTVLMEVEFGDAAFADLMSNSHAGETGDAKVYSDDYIGMRHENKDVTVPFSPVTRATSAELLATMADQAEAENPGWTADRGEENWNHHRVGNGRYRFIMRRWVEASATVEPAKPAAPKKRK